MPPPPTFYEATGEEAPERAGIADLPTLRDEDCRAALVKHAENTCCWGTRAAHIMDITNVYLSSAFRLVLESFCEARSTAWDCEPYTGQVVDGPECGPAPLPWDIPAKPMEYFKHSSRLIEVPHTASVRPCGECRATGQVRCGRCRGRGYVECSRTTTDNHGNRCTQTYEETCDTCGGKGQVTCPTCCGYQRLKVFIMLTVTWTNHLVMLDWF